MVKRAHRSRPVSGCAHWPVKKSSSRITKNKERILVLESEEGLVSSILTGLQEVAPEAVVDVARDLDEALRMAADDPVALFVIDLDTASGPDDLRDLRAGHPRAGVVILMPEGTTSLPEESEAMGEVHLLQKPFPDPDFVDMAQRILRPGTEMRSVPRQRVLVVDDSLMLLNYV